ncbi:MAG TPA: hypothetical protein VFQ16_09935 [Burkholderiaceae bacterium]|nr:hypothetical protein [Burkholderiaceae bacterium]
MDGAWDIAHDAGTGPIGAQLWQVTQSGCDVSLKAMSADGSAATLFAGVGAAGDAGFWVAWTLTDGPCRVDGRVAVDVTADMLDGTVSEARSHRGAGECPGAGLGIVTARVHGTRR